MATRLYVPRYLSNRMKALLLYNIKAGKGRIARRIARIVAIFEEHGIALQPRQISFTENPFEGAEDTELAVICGGDGTINYVVNSMFAKGIAPTLGIIPTGTANDFAAAIGMKRRMMAAARQIATGTERRVDCGEVNGSYFVNVLSFGVLTTTSQHTPDIEKHLVGKLAYIRVGARDIFTMHRIPLFARINGEEHSMDAAMFLAFNGKSAGQFRLAPDAKVDDGMLDIVILDYNNPATTIWNMMRYLMGHKSQAVHYLRSAEITLHTELHEPTDVDGQPGPTFPMSIRCLHNALKVRC